MALSPHSEKVLYLNFGPFCVEFIYSHCVCMGTPQGFLPQCKDLHGFRLNGDFDLTLCVNYCLFLCGGPARERGDLSRVYPVSCSVDSLNIMT